MIARCRSCGRPLIWAVDERSGAGFPVDLEPVGNGNVTLDLSGPKPIAHVLKRFEEVPGGTVRFVSHFSTCPDSAKWKRL